MGARCCCCVGARCCVLGAAVMLLLGAWVLGAVCSVLGAVCVVLPVLVENRAAAAGAGCLLLGVGCPGPLAGTLARHAPVRHLYLEIMSCTSFLLLRGHRGGCNIRNLGGNIRHIRARCAWCSPFSSRCFCAWCPEHQATRTWGASAITERFSSRTGWSSPARCSLVGQSSWYLISHLGPTICVPLRL